MATRKSNLQSQIWGNPTGFAKVSWRHSRSLVPRSLYPLHLALLMPKLALTVNFDPGKRCHQLSSFECCGVGRDLGFFSCLKNHDNQAGEGLCGPSPIAVLFWIYLHNNRQEHTVSYCYCSQSQRWSRSPSVTITQEHPVWDCESGQRMFVQVCGSLSMFCFFYWSSTVVQESVRPTPAWKESSFSVSGIFTQADSYL